MKQNTTKQPDSKEGLHTQAEAALISLLNILDGGLDVTVKSKSQAHADFETLKNERKALLDSRAELAKALQDMMSGYGALMAVIGEMEANVKGQEKDWHDCKLLAIDYFENAKQVLKYAGLTDK